MNETAKSFPFRTLLVCFTTWLIATEILVFDQLKFNAKAELLDQARVCFADPSLLSQATGLPISRAAQEWSGYDGEEALQ